MRLGSTTRRGLLAVLGAAATAGCAGVFDEPEEPTIDGSVLQNLGPAPSIDRPLPVTLADDHFATGRDRAESLLADVPEEFDVEAIPNEAVRNELNEVIDRANEELDAATGPSSTLDRLEQLRRGRGSAANVNAAWRSIEQDLDRERVRERAGPIRTRLDEFRDRWTYTGDDPVRAVVVHDTIENLAARAEDGVTRDVESNLRRPANAVTIGLLAGDLERARAALDDASAVFDTFDATVSGDVASAIESGVESLLSTLDGRQADLPDGDPDEPSTLVEPDVSDTPAARALEQLYRFCADLDWIRDAVEDRPATAVLRSHDRLARFDAFESVRERVTDGERFEISSAEDVIDRRSAAVSAIETARDESAYPVLARSELSTLVAGVRYIDGRIQRVGDETSPRSLRRDVAEYVILEETARAVPSADETVAGSLDAAAEDTP